uniref:non-specific serine/threonine protein kinase n=1 Tax=Lutzomyia longipalpis TaxID=7200 RepID=A0A1B0EWQ0_LUTLO
MSVSREAISVRNTRLTKGILSRNDAGLNREKLLDAFLVLFDECNREKIKRNDRNVQDFVAKYRPVVEETKMLRVNAGDFTVKNLIGKGYFGDVHLVQEKATGDVYAMKKVKKSSYTTSQVREERDIMAQRASEWITSLQYAFQDALYLYLVMEYLPGGDLLSLMIRNGAFDEDLARFYLAELTLALNALHTMGYVHRDVKPENILVDRCGHLKLADFGNAALINKDGNVISLSPVGTPDYIAPELLKTLTGPSKVTNTIHSATCDFWSMGIIGYELVTEVTPFHHDNVTETYAKILAHCEKSPSAPRLKYPEHLVTSEPFRHLIENLLTGPETRLTHAKILKHPFFRGIKWAELRHQPPPIIPMLKSDDDVSNFEDVDRKSRRNTFVSKSGSSVARIGEFSGENLPFIGYTYIHEEATEDPQRPEKHHEVKVKEMKRLGKAQCEEICSLQNKLLGAEKKIRESMSAEKNLRECKGEIFTLKEQLQSKMKELATAQMQVKRLKSDLKVEEEERIRNDEKIKETLQSIQKKWEKTKQDSDQLYEKQIAEKATQIAHLNEKLQTNAKELEAKRSECQNFLETIETYRDKLKRSKENLATDQAEFDRKKKNIEEVYQTKIQELKQNVRDEKNARQEAERKIRELQQELDATRTHQTSLQEARSVSERATGDLRGRIKDEMEENRKIREEKVKLERTLEELRLKFDDLERENRDLNAEIEKYATESHRSSVHEENFRSCRGSMQDLNQAVEEQLRTDLERANERIEAEQKRANDLEVLVRRLEDAIAKLETPRTTRKELDRARAEGEEVSTNRKVYLDMLRLERERDNLKTELKDERQKVSMLTDEKNKAEIKWKISQEAGAGKDREIRHLQREIDQAKATAGEEAKQRRSTEQELMTQKVEVVEQLAKIQKLEEIIENGRSTLRSLQQKFDSATAENKRLMQEIAREKEDGNRARDVAEDTQTEVSKLRQQYDFLKAACEVTEIQLTELEDLVQSERKMNAEQKERIEELLTKLRAKEEESLELKQKINALETEKRAVESKLQQAQNDLIDAQDQLEKVSTKLSSEQQNLIETTTNFIATEEQLELTKGDLDKLQVISESFQKEVHALKEENTQILTELFEANEKINRLAHDLNVASIEMSEQKRTIDDLNGLLDEKENYYVQRDVRSAATLAQHKKLIDYLQAKVEELSHKKKGTLLDKLFGGSDSGRKENITPNVPYLESTGKLKKTEEQLKKQRDRNNQLTEKLLKAKTEIRTMKQPPPPAWEDVKQASDVETEQEQRRDFQKREEERLSRHSSAKRSYRMHHLEMTMEGTDEPNVFCLVCQDPVFTSNTFWRCRVCNCTVHRKCRGKVTSSCDGEPTLPPLEAIDEVDTAAQQARIEKCESLTGDSYRGELLFKPHELTPSVVVHCVYEVDEETLLLGCETGLYSLHLRDGHQLVPIEGIDCVNYIAITPTLAKVVLIGNGGEHLFQCDLRHLLTRGRRLSGPAGQQLEVSTLDLPFANRQSNERWHFARIRGDNECLDEAVVIAATTCRIVIMRFDTDIGKFRPTRALDTATPVTAVLFTRHTAIVSSDKFFEIDLESLAAEEFVDLSDASLSATRSWQPLAAFQITDEEYLLCFSEFGVFTDEYGCRSRSGNISWTYTPTGFSFRRGILFITHFNMVQIMRLRRTARMTDDTAEGDIESKLFLTLPHPRILNDAGKEGIYVLVTENETNEQKIVLVDGAKALQDNFSGSSDTLATVSSTSSGSSTSSSLKRVKSIAV